MKTNFILFILLTVLFGMASCSDDDNDSQSIEYTVTVASVQRIMFISDHFSPYYVKHEGGNEWKEHSYIRDFSHQEGYEYVLRVRRDYDKIMEEMIGGSVYSYHLLEEISKTAKDSENIPLQKGWVVIASKGTGNPEYPYYMYLPGYGKWEKIAAIEGFEYEEGYEYKLTVSHKYNGASASPKYACTLEKIHSKEKRDSEGLPK